MDKQDEEQLLRQAFKYQDALTCYAFGLLRDWYGAQDIVQESFVVLLRKSHQFRASAKIYPYLRQFVRYEALNHLRARQREKLTVNQELTDLVDAQLAAHLSEHEALTIRRRRQALQDCMLQLKGQSLQLLLGFYRDAQSCQMLATLFARSANAVRLALSRLRKTLRKCVDRKMGVEDQ